MEASVKRLMLVDDHAIVRSGLRRIFGDCPDIVIDCEAADGQEALALLKTRTVDAVLLDLSLPGRSGLEVLGRMRAECPKLRILVVSMHAEAQFAVNVMKAGALGYVCKETASDEIVDATRIVLKGGRYVSEWLASALAASIGTSEREPLPHERLSPREFDVFCQLASGKSVSVIARELFLSVKTISTHRSRILEKMGMKTVPDLTYYAITHALIA